jgi:hypothetical protein
MLAQQLLMLVPLIRRAASRRLREGQEGQHNLSKTSHARRNDGSEFRYAQGKDLAEQLLDDLDAGDSRKSPLYITRLYICT